MDQRVVVFGSTGTAGSGAVRACVEDPRVTEVRAVTRRELSVRDPKVREIRCGDFGKLDSLADALTGVQACFFCLGIPQSKAESEAHYREITVGYPLEAARVLKEKSPTCTFHYVSGGGTDPSGKSWMMWARVKGEAENRLREYGMHRLFCHRPGYIRPEDASWLGRSAYAVMSALSPKLAITGVDLGRAMIEAQLTDRAGGVLENHDLLALIAKRA